MSYRDLERATGTTFYFATPYHSWEHGTDENTNASFASTSEVLVDEAPDPGQVQ